MSKIKYTLIRDLEFGGFIETFLVFSVASIVAIRVFLNLAGFPQLGGDGLHIAHMLWGGLIMLIVLGVVLAFLNLEVKKFAAIFGGIGFGVFIDEIGKFVTSDNDYFFEATFSLIYIVLAIFYVVARTVEKRKEPTKEEYLINAIEYLKGAMINGISKADKKKAMQYLSKSDGNSGFVKNIRAIFEDIDITTPKKSNRLTKIRTYFADLYMQAIRWKWFGGLFVTVFVVSASLNFFVQFGSIIEAITSSLSSVFSGAIDTKLNTTQAMSLLVDATAGAFVVLGAFKMRKSRIEAYYLFKKAMLIDIFLGQIFIFYTSPALALVGLVVKIAILEALNYMISQEKYKEV